MNTEFDEIIKKISGKTNTVISFDIFDTAVLRPFYRPTDLFFMLDEVYEKYYSGKASFYSIRIDGEMGCRAKYCGGDKEDILLDEIYEYISDVYGISAEICSEIKEYETQLEMEFCKRRESIYSLYMQALKMGKKIVFTSDMYLPKQVIAQILEKNGYFTYHNLFISSETGKLKRTGKLFENVLNTMCIRPEDVLHIGDNFESDVKSARAVGVEGIYFPKCGNMLEDRIRINGAGKYMNSDLHAKNKCPLYGAATALVGNKFFDNPFVKFDADTTYNQNSYLMGYFCLGFHLIAQLEWLDATVKRRKLHKVYFTSRDGYLLMKANEILCKHRETTYSSAYIFVSRKSMLPWIINEAGDMYSLPIMPQRHGPRDIDELLAFCIRDGNLKGWAGKVEACGLSYEEPFSNIYEYHKYIKIFIENRYDAQKHQEAKELVAAYFDGLEDDSGIYDLGYSASIHRAICKASGKYPTALFMHSDFDQHLTNSRRGNFEIECFMEKKPEISGLMREFFFSDVRGSCIGYEFSGSNVVSPRWEKDSRLESRTDEICQMHQGALDFVDDYYSTFQPHMRYMDMKREDFTIPFESLLVCPAHKDMEVFSHATVEDKVYGNAEHVNLTEFWKGSLWQSGKLNGRLLKDILGKILEENEKSEIVFFGTGKIANQLLDEYPELEIKRFIDNNPQKHNLAFRGGTIHGLDDMGELNGLFIVISAVRNTDSIEEQLKEKGLKKGRDFAYFYDLFN